MAVQSVDVVIIGAGAAGLTAAYDLNFGTNYTYKILEANSGIGGRLQKLTTLADFPIDLGGEWIHVNPSILNEIFAEPDVDVTDFIETVPYLATYEIFLNGEWTTVDYGNTSDFKFVNYTWFDFFNSWIAPGLMPNLELNCAVDSIDWSVSPINISCDDGRLWTASHVIITTSIGVLQYKDINFTPALPEATEAAINEYIMMDGVKVFMSFKERFYREAWGMGSDYELNLTMADSDRFFYDESFGQTTNANVLGMIAVGELAEQYVNLTNEEIIDDILEELDNMYDGLATPNYIEGYVQNWNEQIFVKGVYTYLGEDDDAVWDSIPTLRQPLDNKLFFAGEAVPANDYENGFAHGAALSGRAAAAKVVVALSNSPTATSRSGESTVLSKPSSVSTP